jgi:hypothetical protein
LHCGVVHSFGIRVARPRCTTPVSRPPGNEWNLLWDSFLSLLIGRIVPNMFHSLLWQIFGRVAIGRLSHDAYINKVITNLFAKAITADLRFVFIRACQLVHTQRHKFYLSDLDKNKENSFMLISIFLYKVGISRIIMSQTKLKMQPTIHLLNKTWILSASCPGSLCKCIVGCIFNSVRLVIIRKILCILVIIHPTYLLLVINKNVFHYTMRNDSFQKFTRMVSYLFEN